MDSTELVRIQLITTVVVTAANVFLVLLTSVYVYLTRQMVKEMRASRDPAVFVDLEFPERVARLAIGNSGQTAALNLKFKVNDAIPWLGRGRFAEGLKGLGVIQDGVSYLPASRVLKYRAGIPDWDKIDEKTRLLQVQVSYENEIGDKFKREFFVDIFQYKGILFESFRDSNLEVAKAIQEAERSQSIRESLDRRFGSIRPRRSTKKRCPMCAELIPQAAKKCSHCGEVFVEAEPHNKSFHRTPRLRASHVALFIAACVLFARRR